MFENFLSYISKYERLLTLIMVFIQTIVVCIGVNIALKELGSSKISELQTKRAESWDIYKANKTIDNEIREFLLAFMDAEKDDESEIISSFFLDKGVEINRMYTEFELCISSNRCDADILFTLACNNALQLSEYEYRNGGYFIFVVAANHENFKKYNLKLNLYRFSKRCIPTASEHQMLPWREYVENL